MNWRLERWIMSIQLHRTAPFFSTHGSKFIKAGAHANRSDRATFHSGAAQKLWRNGAVHRPPGPGVEGSGFRAGGLYKRRIDHRCRATLVVWRSKLADQRRDLRQPARYESHRLG